MNLFKLVMVLIWICAVNGGSLLGQDSRDTLGIANLEEKDCEKIIHLSLQLLKIRETPGICEQLADCHYALENYVAAESWYENALRLDPYNPECSRKYAEVLRVRFKFQAAIEQMQSYGRMVNDPEGVASFVERCHNGMLWIAKQGKYTVKPFQVINSQESEIVAYEHDSTLYFYSRAPLGNIGKERQPYPNKRPFNLYAYDLDANSARPRLVAEKCSPNELGLGMVWDGSSGQYYVARFENEGQREGFVSLYRSRRDGYGNVKEDILPFCQKSPNNHFHPAIDPTGQVMVFVSDCDSGFGGRDLFYCTRQRAKGWSEPRNLGMDVNTAGDETYPCFSSTGRLFFASDGHSGFGKTDIYAMDVTIDYVYAKEGARAKADVQVAWSIPMNVGASVNSAFDDFAMVWNPAYRNNSGFFTSNRPDSAHVAQDPKQLDQNHGRCNVFSFQFRPEIVGRVMCLENGKEIAFPSVTLWEDGLPAQVLSSAGDGTFYGNPMGHGPGELVVRKRGYKGMSIPIDLAKVPQGEDLRRDFFLPYDSIQFLRLRIKNDSAEIGSDTLVVCVKALGDRPSENIYKEFSQEIELPLLRGRDYTMELSYGGKKRDFVSTGRGRLAVDTLMALDITTFKLPAAAPPRMDTIAKVAFISVPPHIQDNTFKVEYPDTVVLDVLSRSVLETPAHRIYFYNYGRISLDRISDADIDALRSRMASDTALILDFQIVTSSGGGLSHRQKSCRERAQAAVRDFSKWLDIPRTRISTTLHTPTVKTNICPTCKTYDQRKMGRLEVRLRH